MRKFILAASLFTLWVSLTGALSYAAFMHRKGADFTFGHGIIAMAGESMSADVAAFRNSTIAMLERKFRSITDIRDHALENVMVAASDARAWVENIEQRASASVRESVDTLGAMISDTTDSTLTAMAGLLDVSAPKTQGDEGLRRDPRIVDASFDLSEPPGQLTLSEIKRRREEERLARINAEIAPSAPPMPEPALWQPEQNALDVEAVLAPRQVTVISSSRDGRIAAIMAGHGDVFKKGDLLIAYDCSDLEAEAEIARMEKDFTSKKAQGSDRLFKLDIISDLDRIGAQVEDKQAQAKARLYDARMKDCEIRAQFDGRVTNRLANAGEYTRTDRVLMEVASNEPLQAEFLIPSKWLRWVNVGAPVTIRINETEKTYAARITRIHGEVDPVSQSIQIIATLDPYQDPLLPGMSGQATLDVEQMRSAGVRGYLEPASYQSP